MDQFKLKEKVEEKEKSIIGADMWEKSGLSEELGGTENAVHRKLVRGRERDHSSKALSPALGSESVAQYRIQVSHEANRALGEIMSRVNSGFEGGKVKRSQLASWVLCRFRKVMSESDLQEIRSFHFDQISYLEALLKRAKKTGAIPQELSALSLSSTMPPSKGKKKRCN